MLLATWGSARIAGSQQGPNVAVVRIVVETVSQSGPPSGAVQMSDTMAGALFRAKAT
jgi:hypothetical protein